MADNMIPQEQVARLFRQADPREFSLFLGAGASRGSGVVLASEMIAEWRRQAFAERAGEEPDFDAWCGRQPWFGSPSEYSELFESLYPDERARQKYVEPKIEAGFPGWGYLYLADIVRAGHLNLIFTTNFDDLVNEALTRYAGYTAVVCAADSEVASINLVTARAKIVKLHGDYLFKALKNTEKDLKELTANMERKFSEFARQCGMIVLGYSGADASIMSLLDRLLGKPGTFPNGVYWGVHDPQAPLSAPLRRVVERHPQKLRLFRCEDFDIFMARLHESLDLQPPGMISEPLRSARDSVTRLLAQTTDRQRANGRIREHAAKLAAQAGGAIAQVSEPAALDLYEAQIALGMRRWKDALEGVQRYAATNPGSAYALAIWGHALELQAEEQGSPALLELAAERWRASAKLDPRYLTPRYCLVRHHILRNELPTAIAEAEQLIELVPQDSNLRVQLSQLYAQTGRGREALALLDEVLARQPDDPQLHAMRANMLDMRSRPTEAVAHLLRAMELLPRNPWIRLQAAAVYTKLGRYRDARIEYEKVIEIAPDNVGFRMQAAVFLMSLGQGDDATAHLRQAVELEPDSFEPRCYLASTLLLSGKPEAALEAIEAALRLDVKEVRLFNLAGDIYAANNDAESAERYYRLSIDTNPDAGWTYLGLVRLLRNLGRDGETSDLIERVLAIDPTVGEQLRREWPAPPPAPRKAKRRSDGAAGSSRNRRGAKVDAGR